MTLHHPLAARLQALEAAFERIQRERMAGLGLLHPPLRVQAVGFAPCPLAPQAMALGVLLTPWFMNLLRLPLQALPASAVPGLDQTIEREIGGRRWAFQGLMVDGPEGVGAFEQVPLFSPMQDFADQASAVATAQAVLDALRPAAVPAVAPVAAPQAASFAAPAAPARRGFLFGRSAASSR